MRKHTRKATDVAGEVFFSLCKSINTPKSLGAWLRYKYSHIELASMDVNPGDYTNASAFFDDYCVSSLLSKYKGLNTGIDLELEALSRFTAAEAQCHETNIRLRSDKILDFPELGSILHAAQRKISSLLGPFSLFCVTDSYGWGPGATYEIPRRKAFVDVKMCELPITVSRSCRALLLNTIAQDLHWSETILGMRAEGPFDLNPHTVTSIQDASRIDTVPKNAKTHRVIAVEPRGNSFLQKGVGGYIRDKLRRVGVNLNDQGINQNLAKAAYFQGFATLDLKAASDTVAKELVYTLLPYDWASFMDAIRTRKAEMPDGSIVILNKFSSMGNGFTFELESLIFWAIAQSLKESRSNVKPIAVYGDDIILCQSLYSEMVSTLAFLGFTVNEEKSFANGNFFESCGKHYFQGKDVTPTYQKDALSDPITRMRFGNRLLRLSYRAFKSFGFEGFDDRYLNAWLALRRLTSEDGTHIYEIPFGTEGDDAWAVTRSYWANQKTKTSMIGLRCRVTRLRKKQFPGQELALLAWSFRLSSRQSEDSDYGLRRYQSACHILDSSPCYGDVSVDAKTYCESHRWVVPTREFDLT